ncbi:MAG: polysaccharide biosynthesis tyrosine autokinase [Clostridia bacterium]|nr:polysaccharide biosynthesis tyrosine autokinase [Clostridia bacterium]
MKKELLTYQDPKSPVSEIFRTLRTNIQFMNTDKKLKTLLITSTFPGEGKSWITANLAVTFAQAGKRVIIVDADMRKGRQYSIFGVLPKPGLSNYLSNIGVDDMENAEEISIANYIQETDVENLHILTAGNVPPNPSELLVSRRMKNLLQELKTMCDLIIIDGTPCDLVTDAIILSRIVDSTMIVTAQKETKKESLTRIVKNIQNVGGKIAGVVVNKMDISSKKYNSSYYYGSITGANMTVKPTRKEQKKMDEYFNSIIKDQEREREEEFGYNDLNHDFEDTMRIETLKKEYPIDDVEDVVEESVAENDIDLSNNYEENTQENYIDESNTFEEKVENNIVENNHTGYQEVEAQVQGEGRISEVKIDQNLDEKTKEILRQVNEYIETEKRKQGENY